MSMTLHSKVNDNLHLRPKLKRDVKACASLCLEDLHCLDCLQCLHVPAPPPSFGSTNELVPPGMLEKRWK